MNIKEIVDKIVKEADINASEYIINDRLDDIHQTRLKLATKMRQWGYVPQKTQTDIHTITTGNSGFAKPFKHAEIKKIEYGPTGGDENSFRCIEKRQDCNGGGCSRYIDGIKYTEDTGSVYIWNGTAGQIRVTYVYDIITKWTNADYTTGTATPDELPEVYHALLWLDQVRRHTGYYSKERYDQLMVEYNELYKLFNNELQRNAPEYYDIVG